MNVTLYRIKYTDAYFWGGDKDKYDKESKAFISAGISVNTYDEAVLASRYFDADDCTIVDRDRIATLAIFGVGIEVISEINTDVNISKQLEAMAEKQLTFTQECKEFNEKININISGNSLSTFNDIMLLEDSCTDELTVNINKGWRIIAVCPQPDQRRPDYILGRWNPDVTVEDYAKR